jgi:hypothetical protein
MEREMKNKIEQLKEKVSKMTPGACRTRQTSMPTERLLEIGAKDNAWSERCIQLSANDAIGFAALKNDALDIIDALLKERDELVEAVMNIQIDTDRQDAKCPFCGALFFYVIDGVDCYGMVHKPDCIVARYSKEKEND